MTFLRSRGLVASVVVVVLVGLALLTVFSVDPGPTPVTPVPHPGATTLPGGSAAKWHQVFNESFSGTSLDTTIWSTCYFWDCTNRANPELEWFDASQVSVHGGKLSLTVKPEATHGRQYVSGMISSFGRFYFTYGYAQIVARMPTGKGLWSAFWTLPESGGWPPEVDIFENFAQTDQVDFVVHYGSGDRSFQVVNLPTFNTAFHTYGLDWEPGTLTWYVDGLEKVRFRISITQASYLLVNLNVWANPPPDASVHFPQSLDVRSIQVFQHPGVGSYTLSPALVAPTAP